MKVVSLIKDYMQIAERSLQIGKYAAYAAYTRQYSRFFDAVLEYLYHAKMEDLAGLIHACDFDRANKIIQENLDNHMDAYIVQTANEYLQIMQENPDFELYLGAELGNIGGCSMPCKDGKMIVYVGLDRIHSKDDINTLVCHELNHLVRQSRLKGTNDTVLERTIDEGLASYAPVYFGRMEWNPATVARMLLSTSEQAAKDLMDHFEKHYREIMSVRHEKITPERMKRYFSVDKSGQTLAGYYVGLHTIHTLVEKGFDFVSLTQTPADKIFEYYTNL